MSLTNTENILNVRSNTFPCKCIGSGTFTITLLYSCNLMQTVSGEILLHIWSLQNKKCLVIIIKALLNLCVDLSILVSGIKVSIRSIWSILVGFDSRGTSWYNWPWQTSWPPWCFCTAAPSTKSAPTSGFPSVSTAFRCQWWDCPV